jgi:hypothetical protein
MGDLRAAEAMVAEMTDIPEGLRSPFLRAETARLRGRLVALAGDEDAAGRGFADAVDGLREIGTRFHLAVALLDQGQWLESLGRSADAEPVLAEGLSIFTDLRANWWIERLTRPTATSRAAG